ncbi:hypothetical protein AC578_1174 [Pseudocercospora eumusae]|uniref:Uncharacterized protein n=1 Tax=Pseudocercospora eumusae TaxID=321146 RepID=A0A139HJW4_9PEZI|nr:hypothetical protein AC578_1174 [Pseudocercospora eumusae]
MQVLNNVSDTRTISTYDNDKSYAYAAVAQNQHLATTEFTATTLALSTECKRIPKACDLNATVGASEGSKISKHVERAVEKLRFNRPKWTRAAHVTPIAQLLLNIEEPRPVDSLERSSTRASVFIFLQEAF